MTAQADNPLIVIGMHRSGTTMLTRLLISAGIEMGTNLGPNYEDPFFQGVNRELLARARAHWANPAPFFSKIQDPDFKNGAIRAAKNRLQHRQAPDGVWGWKDPRTTLTLPIWLALYPGARVVNLMRNGLDVSMSLYRREIRRYLRLSKDRRLFPPTMAACFALWQIYVSAGLSASAFGNPYLELRYEDFLLNPHDTLKKTVIFAGLDPEQDLSNLVRGIGQPRPPSVWLRLLAHSAWKMSIRDKRLMEALGYTPEF